MIPFPLVASPRYTLQQLAERALEDLFLLKDGPQIEQRLSELQNEGGTPLEIVNQIEQGLLLHAATEAGTKVPSGKIELHSTNNLQVFGALSSNPLLPFQYEPLVNAFYASALILNGQNTHQSSAILKGLQLLEEAIYNFGKTSFIPEFLRAKRYLTLPLIFDNQLEKAQKDLNALLQKLKKEKAYAPPGIQSEVQSLIAQQEASAKQQDKSFPLPFLVQPCLPLTFFLPQYAQKAS
ncbi:MAG: hypothetical protein ACFB10_12320 [Salibacteraceae bacterium]